MKTRLATKNDIYRLSDLDTYISPNELRNSIDSKRIYILEDQGILIGWLRYGLFWDSIPFMNMMFILQPYRGQGLGGEFLDYWEGEMKLKGYKTLMTSTQSNEFAQHFYQRMGYITIGGFTPIGDNYELVLQKNID